MGSACSLTFALIVSSIFSNIPPAGSQECNSDKGHAVCFTKEKLLNGISRGEAVWMPLQNQTILSHHLKYKQRTSE